MNPEYRRYLLDSGFQPFAELADALENTPPVTAIRLNPRKPGAVPSEGARPVPWHPNAYLLPERPDFTLDPAMHQGAYYVQDPSSMFVAEILRQLLPSLPPTPRVLDLCAAPGGKTTAITDLLPDGSLMVSNEYDFRRAEILKENIIKWGYPWSVVTRGDTARFRALPGFFDLVVVDAPCSGEGMMRKDPKAAQQWSPLLVRQCAALQEEILDNAAATLRPGGFLVYSTCTFNPDENERQTARLLATGAFAPVPITLDPAWNILSTLPPHVGTRRAAYDMPSLRFLPGRVEGEGYTVAVLRKTEAAPDYPAVGWSEPKAGGHPRREDPRKPRRGKKDNRDNSRQPQFPEAELMARVPASLRSAIASLHPRLASWRDGEIAAIPEAIHPSFLTLSPHLDIIHAGITLAEVKGRDCLPTQSLAMAAPPLWRGEAERPSPFPSFEIDTATALAYLRRQSLSLPAEAPRGYLLLTHRPSPGAAPLPLGFVKNLGNRANNLYPAPWRVLKS